MRDDTIVFAAQFQDPEENQRLPHSTIVYSRDHGATWRIGTGEFDDTTESQVVELEPGTLMLNCRYNRQSTRVVMTTRDLGRTWQKHSTNCTHNSAVRQAQPPTPPGDQPAIRAAVTAGTIDEVILEEIRHIGHNVA